MKRSVRGVAALLLLLLLPLQGLAAACAQVCLKAQLEPSVMEHDSAGAANHCHEPEGVGQETPGVDGKCCHAHTFMMQPPALATVVALPSFRPLPFVARWTSFIPEEPSPPPIASAA